MRSLSAPLLAAQKAATGRPYVRAVVQDTIRDINHLQFSEAYTSEDTDNEHDAAADSDYLHRVRINGGQGYAQYERDAGSGWTNLSSSNDADRVAIAVTNDTLVIVVYNRGTSIYFRESTDQGATFGSETLIVSDGATPACLTVEYKNTSGDLVVFWEKNNALRHIRRTSGAFGSPATWTLSTNSLNGVDATKSGDFLIALTGTDTDDRPTVWTCVLGDGVLLALDTWGQHYILNQAESDEDITFQAPFIDSIDFRRITFVEKFSGTPNYTRTYWTVQPAGNPGADWEWQDPAPLDNDTDHGYAITYGVSAPSTVFLSRPGQVLEASLSVTSLDMSANLIEAIIVEEDGIRQRAELVFDNAAGDYAGPPAPIAIAHDVDLGLGYDDAYSRPPRQSIVGWEYRRDGGRSLFVLFTRGIDYWLSRSRPRTTIQYNTGLSLVQIVRGAANRAGLQLLNLSSSSRANSFDLWWTIHPHQSSLHALEAALELMPDIYVNASSGFGIGVLEPSTSDAVDYTYGTDHAVYHSRTRDQGVTSLSEILAEGVLGQAFDFALMNHDKPIEDRRRDPHATAYGDADDHACARLRKAQLRKNAGYLITPPNCGLQVGDVIAYSDALVSSTQIRARVASITTRFRRAPSAGRTTLYEQRVGLGGL